MRPDGSSVGLPGNTGLSGNGSPGIGGSAPASPDSGFASTKDAPGNRAARPSVRCLAESIRFSTVDHPPARWRRLLRIGLGFGQTCGRTSHTRRQRQRNRGGTGGIADRSAGRIGARIVAGRASNRIVAIGPIRSDSIGIDSFRVNAIWFEPIRLGPRRCDRRWHGRSRLRFNAVAARAAVGLRDIGRRQQCAVGSGSSRRHALIRLSGADGKWRGRRRLTFGERIFARQQVVGRIVEIRRKWRRLRRAAPRQPAGDLSLGHLQSPREHRL